MNHSTGSTVRLRVGKETIDITEQHVRLAQGHLLNTMKPCASRALIDAILSYFCRETFTKALPVNLPEALTTQQEP